MAKKGRATPAPARGAAPRAHEGQEGEGGGAPAAAVAAERGATEKAAGGAGATAEERTFGASSGRHFALAGEPYPKTASLAAALRGEVVTASPGDVLEVLALYGAWAYGRRFKEALSAVNEGVFRLEWVDGLKQVFENGQRQPVMVDIASLDYGFKEPYAKDAKAKLRAKRQRKKLTDAERIWAEVVAGDDGRAARLEREEGKAARKAAALEREAEEAEQAAEQAAEKAAEAAERRRGRAADAAQERQEAAEVRRSHGAVGPAEAVEAAEAADEDDKVRHHLYLQTKEEARQRLAAAEKATRQASEAAEEARRLAVEADAAQQRAAEAQAEAQRLAAEAAEARRAAAEAEKEARQCEAQSAAPTKTELEEQRAADLHGAWPPLSSRFPVTVRSARPSQRRTSAPAWEAQWEHQAANLERLLSESSSGVESSDSSAAKRRRIPTLQRRMATRRFTGSLLAAKRSGELHAIAEEWERAHSELASQASDLSALNEKVRRSLRGAHRTEEIERIVEAMASEADKKAAEVKQLKENVFKALIELKRSKHVEEVDDAQKMLEMDALQLRRLMRRAWQGMVATTRNEAEVERLADEYAAQLQTKAEALKKKMRGGLLRAHRAGELLELKEELDEIADSVPHLPQGQGLDSYSGSPQGGAAAASDAGVPWPPFQAPVSLSRRRWADMTSSDSDTGGGRGCRAPGSALAAQGSEAAAAAPVGQDHDAAASAAASRARGCADGEGTDSEDSADDSAQSCPPSSPSASVTRSALSSPGARRSPSPSPPGAGAGAPEATAASPPRPPRRLHGAATASAAASADAVRALEVD